MKKVSFKITCFVKVARKEIKYLIQHPFTTASAFTFAPLGKVLYHTSACAFISNHYSWLVCVGFCHVGLPTKDRQRPRRQSTGPNAKKCKTN